MIVSPVAATAASRAVSPPEPGPRRSFGEVLRSSAGRSLPQTTAKLSGIALDTARTIEQAQRRLDSVLDAARRGRTFTAQELLALQTVAYRYAQTVDLAARMVEHGAQTVKQAVNTQV